MIGVDNGVTKNVTNRVTNVTKNLLYFRHISIYCPIPLFRTRKNKGTTCHHTIDTKNRPSTMLGTVFEACGKFRTYCLRRLTVAYVDSRELVITRYDFPLDADTTE